MARFCRALLIPSGYARRIIIVVFLVNGVRAGIGVQSFAFMIDPIRDETGWSASALTLCITLEGMVAAITAPYIGRILDKHSIRLVVVGGLLANGAMLIGGAAARELWQLALAMVVLGGIVQACIGGTLLTALVSKWFYHAPGQAMAVSSAGSNVGILLIPPLLVTVLTATNNWRQTWFFIGLIPIASSLVILFALHNSRRQSERHDETIAKNTSECSKSSTQALRSPQFWLLMTVWNMVDFSMKGSLVNRIPFVTEMGFDLTGGLSVTILYGLFAILGKITTGWLAERFPLEQLGSLLALIYSVGLYLFTGTDSVVVLSISMGVLGGVASGGLVALMPIILVRYFGRAHQGAISGIAIGLTIVSGIGGPLTASAVKDMFGSYQSGFIFYMILIATAVPLFVVMRRAGKRLDGIC